MPTHSLLLQLALVGHMAVLCGRTSNHVVQLASLGALLSLQDLSSNVSAVVQLALQLLDVCVAASCRGKSNDIDLLLQLTLM